MPTLRPVVLSGGSGTRLWPLSTPERPKQFASLLGEKSLFEATLTRMMGLDHVADPIVVAGAGHSRLIAECVVQMGIEVTTILEPIGRNTAPAALAAASIVPEDEVLVIVPSDQVISDVAAFRDAVSKCAVLAESGHVVALGVVPTRPETGYGYVELGEPTGPGFTIGSFVEKPQPDLAQQMVIGGNHLWNAGMFVTNAGHLISEASQHAPGLFEAVSSCLPEEFSDEILLDPKFGEVEAISIDYAIMERTSTGAVLPLDAGWSDVGSFESLHEASPQDENGNSLGGSVVVQDVHDSLVRATSKTLVVSGVDGMAVVETPDGVLVIPLSRSQDVKRLAEET